MNRELYKPVSRVIVALILIALVKFAAILTLKKAAEFYLFVDIALSIAIVIVLLNFMNEFNRLLADKDARTIITGIVIALVIVTLYVSFLPYLDVLPSGLYHLIFFILLLIPIYSVWEVLHRNSDRIAELFILTEKRIKCSCGWENPEFGRYCGGCGSPLPRNASFK